MVRLTDCPNMTIAVYYGCKQQHIHLHTVNTLKCVSIGTPKTINFPFGTNGKLMILGVPIFKHIVFFSIIVKHLISQMSSFMLLC